MMNQEEVKAHNVVCVQLVYIVSYNSRYLKTSERGSSVRYAITWAAGTRKSQACKFGQQFMAGGREPLWYREDILGLGEGQPYTP